MQNWKGTSFFLVACLILAAQQVLSRTVRISNSLPRRDVDGNIVDCHSGNIIYQWGTYYMYGEHYGNSTGWDEKTVPTLYVYTSTDMESWVPHGPMLKNAPKGTYFTPQVVFNNQTNRFVAWFNAYPGGCCEGNFGVAQSIDGIVFDIVSLNVTPKYQQVDCNGLFVDDDGTGYVIYSSLAYNHQVSIEKLTSDFLSSTKENYGFFPDGYVEGSVIWKRNGVYYVGYGSCCCFCRAGSGFAVFAAKDISGPWQRLGVDKNCNTTDVKVCGEAGERIGDSLIINAQGIAVSKIPTRNGDIFLWQGERWLSAPHNNPECVDECQEPPCKEPKEYIKGHGFSYWYPLTFDVVGDVQQFAPFVDSFDLELN